MNFSLAPVDNDRLARLCGTLDGNLKNLGEALAVKIRRRGECFTVIGEAPAAARAQSALQDSYASAVAADAPAAISKPGEAPPAAAGFVAEQAAGVAALSANQAEFLRSLREAPVVFGEGPAGTGKTFLAVAGAVEALQQMAVERIVLVRPAVEAGENLGFLPGDMSRKVHPYLMPLMDALRDICGAGRATRLVEAGTIELAPLAYMRGRTLKNSFVIFDEAQNATVGQMKMLLTRLGRKSRCAITGDCSQIDLPAGQLSGLTDILGRIERISECKVVRFARQDEIRHPVVTSILAAYEK